MGAQWDSEDTAILEHVYLGPNHVGVIYIYPHHCEAVPEDPESTPYRFLSTSQAAQWMRLRIASTNAAEAFADACSLGPAQ
jgi:hypothetical protein